MAFIPKPTFPNVPKLPGVPQLLRSSNFPANPGPLIGTAAALGALWRALFSKNKWGVFNTPKPPPQSGGFVTDPVTGERALRITVGNAPAPTKVIDPDSIYDFGYRNERDMIDYPVQDGSFTVVNKVNQPYEASIRMTKGGSEADRQKFLDQCDALIDSTELYQIITDVRTYRDVNPYRFEVQRRGSNAAHWLTEVDLYFREIRFSQAQYTVTSVSTLNAADPSAAPVDNRGTVSGESVASPPSLDGVVTK